jgi:hypothetical protein
LLHDLILINAFKGRLRCSTILDPASLSGPLRSYDSQTFLMIVTALHVSAMDLWSEFLATDPEVLVRFPGLLDFLSSGSATGFTQLREYN